MGTKFFLACLTNCIELQANFETLAALTFWFRIIFKTPVNCYLSNSKITATVCRRLPIWRRPAAAPGTRGQQRIHSSGLKIPVGRTCCMLLWVCERSLKESAVFTKRCDLLWTHVTLRIDPPTLRCGRTFRRLRRDWIPSDAPNWSKKWCCC